MDNLVLDLVDIPESETENCVIEIKDPSNNISTFKKIKKAVSFFWKPKRS